MHWALWALVGLLGIGIGLLAGGGVLLLIGSLGIYGAVARRA